MIIYYSQKLTEPQAETSVPQRQYAPCDLLHTNPKNV